MQIGIRHPEGVNKLVLASAFYKREGMMPGFFEGFKHATLESMPQPLQAAFLEINPNKDDLQIMFERDVTRMAEFKDWSDEVLTSIKAKSLVLAGDHDVMTNEHTVAMARLIPNAELLIVPGTHGSYLNEICSINSKSKIPEMTIALVKEFLDK
jgi:pimeloyl-ACP methyl ester carboxylesterase